MSPWFWASYTLLWLLVVPLAILNLVLFRQLGIAIMGTARGMNRSGIPPGRKLPLVESTTVDGRLWSTDFLRGRPHILVFAIPTCKECKKILRDLRRVTQLVGVTPVLLMFSDKEQGLGFAQEHSIDFEVVYISQVMAAILDVSGTPFGYGVDSEGIIRAKGLINSTNQLEAMCQAALPPPSAREPAEVSA